MKKSIIIQTNYANGDVHRTHYVCPFCKQTYNTKLEDLKDLCIAVMSVEEALREGWSFIKYVNKVVFVCPECTKEYL